MQTPQTKQARHTPGDWKKTVYHNSETGATRIVIESTEQPYQIATVHHDEIGNACLLAAAPELLEALQWAIQELCEAWDEPIEKAIPEKYRNLIAHATGE